MTVRAHVGDAADDPATPSTRASPSTPPGLPRRAAVAALSAAALFASPPPPISASTAGSLTQRGMAKFIQNDVEGSVEDFDLVISAEPRQAPYLWRGPGARSSPRTCSGAWGLGGRSSPRHLSLAVSSWCAVVPVHTRRIHGYTVHYSQTPGPCNRRTASVIGSALITREG